MYKSEFSKFISLVGGKLEPSPVDFYEAYRLANHSIHFFPLAYYEHLHVNQHIWEHYLQTHRHKAICIWEDQWLHQQAIVKSRLQALTDTCTRIHARKTDIIRTDKWMSDSFLNEHHLYGTTGSYYKFALTYNGRYVAMATFSKSRVMHDGPVYYRSYVLERFTNANGVLVSGGLLKLIHHMISHTHATHLMTYIDTAWSQGEGFIRSGFVLAGYKQPTPFYVDKVTGRRSLKPLGHTGYTLWNTGSVKLIFDKR